jgi:hypothetical protein
MKAAPKLRRNAASTRLSVSTPRKPSSPSVAGRSTSADSGSSTMMLR